jgi:serine/threonine-protein kinase HipA
MTDGSIYQPVDSLYLWLLADPSSPVLVGELHLVRSSQGVSLRYTDDWLRDGFPLSEDLPLIGQEFLPAERAAAAGAVDDARARNPLHRQAQTAVSVGVSVLCR